jgi:hypothetical protein
MNKQRYHITIEEIVFDENNPNKAFSAQRKITLPFIPTTGLRLSFDQMGLAIAGEYIIEEVMWDCVGQELFCFSERPLKNATMIEIAAKDMNEAGWSIEHWDEDSKREGENRTRNKVNSIDHIITSIICLLRLKTLPFSKKELKSLLGIAVNGLYGEVRPEGNTQRGELAIETLRMINDRIKENHYGDEDITIDSQ